MRAVIKLDMIEGLVGDSLLSTPTLLTLEISAIYIGWAFKVLSKEKVKVLTEIS